MAVDPSSIVQAVDPHTVASGGAGAIILGLLQQAFKRFSRPTPPPHTAAIKALQDEQQRLSKDMLKLGYDVTALRDQGRDGAAATQQLRGEISGMNGTLNEMQTILARMLGAQEERDRMRLQQRRTREEDTP